MRSCLRSFWRFAFCAGDDVPNESRTHSLFISTNELGQKGGEDRDVGSGNKRRPTKPINQTNKKKKKREKDNNHISVADR